MIRLYMTTAVLMGTLLSVAPAYAGDAAKGRAKSIVCSACHGVDGNNTINPLWPNLAGQHEAYLVKQIKAFRSGERNDPIMTPMAIGLSDADIDNLAAFYASQKQQ